MGKEQLSFYEGSGSRRERGGSLRRFRRGRGARPLCTTGSLHLVLRSSVATGPRRFTTPRNREFIQQILKKFSDKFVVQVLSMGIVSNHLHLHLKIHKRCFYKPFIQALTSRIASFVCGLSSRCSLQDLGIQRFWDQRPYTRVI